MYKINSFESREQAGHILAENIAELNLKSPYIMAIPRGGIQVAEGIADRLKKPIHPLIVKKLPAPENPEFGFGAVTEDETKVLNTKAVAMLNLSNEEIEEIAKKVVKEIQHRISAFGKLNDAKIATSDVIIVDDGIATGYSLIAAIETIKKRNPVSLTVAVPVSSDNAYNKVKSMADNIICPIVSSETYFAVGSYYKEWYDLTENEIKQIISDYKEKFSD